MLRNCIGCGQVDDHPRHVVGLPDGSDVPWHHDCHARATGCEVCAAVAESGFTGDELRAHITDNDPGAKAARARNEGKA